MELVTLYMRGKLTLKTEELVKLIKTAKKKTPLIALVKSDKLLPRSFNQIIVGEQNQVLSILSEHIQDIQEISLHCTARNSAINPLNIEHLHARIEFGALIRDHVIIEEEVVVMMGAVINVGAHIKKRAMIDMGAVIGARAIIGQNCHVGANAVIAGVLEPPSANPVIIEEDVLIGAGAVVLEGVHIHKGAVVGANAVVTEDVEENTVVVGSPAKAIKVKDKKTELKTQLNDDLRYL